MRRVFQELPEEKQMRIINAAMEVFSKNTYKQASTDDIASKAGISKGSLFYYFQNKKRLFLFVYEYAGKMMKVEILDEKYWLITDFFELMSYASKKKLDILERNPYILDFAVRCFYPEDEAITAELEVVNQNLIRSAFEMYFKNVDFSKFKEGVNPEKIYEMLLWMADGYMSWVRRSREAIKAEKLAVDFNEWACIMKRIAYKEEFIHGEDD